MPGCGPAPLLRPALQKTNAQSPAAFTQVVGQAPRASTPTTHPPAACARDKVPTLPLPPRCPSRPQRKMDKVKAALGHMRKLEEARSKLGAAEEAVAKLRRAVRLGDAVQRCRCWLRRLVPSSSRPALLRGTPVAVRAERRAAAAFSHVTRSAFPGPHCAPPRFACLDPPPRRRWRLRATRPAWLPRWLLRRRPRS